ncbi:DUF4097 family beta strand repeat protein [Litoribacter alkaliphilus]|uniref:DUF4097 family beta strand repeat protein n=1 Tax=Litoribacter ruber TaxID=702568 RepID=A0AAP2CIH9_9BACT|nr:DUF4097 family beta strand repeat-containing protein [Litoribacter alkaliphilus]MBS9522477.1 DUF4097 family beta strand repeat protein [Litoribacter alkaliphilus]
MLRKVCLLVWSIWAFSGESSAQISKDFIVEERSGFNLVKLDFASYKGISRIQRDHSGHPLSIQANLAKVNILPTFTHSIEDNILFASLDHSNVESENLGKSLSSRLFSNTNDDFDHEWLVGLNSNFMYDLDLYFGIGKAILDLSNINVANCKVKTATADVSLEYGRRAPNPISMDTMAVIINMGNVDVQNLNFSNARHMIFDVNYGKVNLSFNGEMPQASHLKASVGAGSVNIELPDQSLPYKIKVKSTAMCRTSIPSYLREVGSKTYVSKGFSENAKNLLLIEIDVSVGSVALK